MTRKRPKHGPPPEVAKHIHNHILVSRAELDGFTSEGEAVRLLVLAELRSRAADQETSLVLTLEAAALAILAIMLSRIPVDNATAGPSTPESGWISAIVLAIVCSILGFVAVALVAPSVWRAVKGNRDHVRAVVWLAAYEQALAEHKSTRLFWGRR